MADDNGIVLELPLEYSSRATNSANPVSAKATARLYKDNLSLLPDNGEAMLLSYRELAEITHEDYTVHITTSYGEKLDLHNLGYKYEDFVRTLNKLRNQLIEKDMLVSETTGKPATKTDIEYHASSTSPCTTYAGEIKLLATSLIVTPQNAGIIRIPYSDILKLSAEDYKITVSCESGDTFIFSGLGRNYDPVKKDLSNALNELSVKAQSLLSEIAPDIDAPTLRKAARLMKDGKAVSRSAIDSLSPALWEKFERKIKQLDFENEYEFLKNLSRQNNLSIGIKKGLMGNLAGDYVWFLFPLCGDISQGHGDTGGNAIAMEAISEEEGGKATYFFRICPRKDYAGMTDAALLDNEAGRIMKIINSCMTAINFRREPIYLTEEKLHDPAYFHYTYSIALLPELRMLRDMFIGRVIHASFDQWKNDVSDLLKFNTTSMCDSERWNKSI